MLDRRLSLLLGALLICTAFGLWRTGVSADKKPAAAKWKPVRIPSVWKRPPGEIERQGRGYAWYRCLFKMPADWKGQPLTVIAESADDARQYYLNGHLLGQSGNFPPTYRSGLGETVRLKTPARFAQPGKINLFAIRVYQSAARTNFNVAPPVIRASQRGVRLTGLWEFQPGDAPVAIAADRKTSRLTPVERVEAAAVLEKTFRKLDNDAGPLSVATATKQFKIPADLRIDAVLADPVIGQPLSIKWDDRGRLWVAEYLQYPNPAGLKMVSRDKHLRTVWDKTPPPPPNHFRGRDRITIHEDTDGDGRYDRHKAFVDGLNLATSFAIGRGGVFVLNPPYLLFYPDKDGDDDPNGDPEVLLEGFGLEDAHSIANSLRWGPDGWLYAAQGSTVSGNIRRPGEKADKIVRSMGQLIWRYHPETRTYEIYAEGGGNSFGVEIDAKGRVFSGHNGGNTRGFHYVQGGYYRKGFGKHGSLSNPYAFGYFANMSHHSVPRFTHTFVIYEGASLPPHYHGKLFGVAPLLSHVVYSQVERDRSSFKTKDLGHPMTTKDSWFRPVDIQVGPDGGVYVADMYEQRIDHSSHYQGRIHTQSGRIYRLAGKDDRRSTARPAMKKLTTPQLIEQLRSKNRWVRRTALRLLGDRRDPAALPILKKRIAEEEGQFSLEALWALNLSGGFDRQIARQTLEHGDPYVRAWTVRLLCDDRRVADDTAKHLAELAYREPHVEVRSQLACSARRLPAEQGLPIVASLLRRSEDAGDIHLPLLLWWAIEANVKKDASQVLKLFDAAETWRLPLVREHILARLARRFAASGLRRDLLSCAALFNRAPAADDAGRLMKGFEEAYKGRSLTDLPPELVKALSRFGGGSLALQIRQGNEEALTKALKLIRNPKADAAERRRIIETLGQIRNKASLPVLLDLAATGRNESVRQATLYALQAFEDEQIGKRVLGMLGQLKGDTLSAAHALLASRVSWSLQMLKAIDREELSSKAAPLPLVRRMLLHGDEQIGQLVRKHWGTVQGASTAEMKREMRRVTDLLANGSGNPYNGKALFKTSCAKCHVLFKQGGKIGPDLTAFKRDDVQRMLVNVINPSLEIREGYETYAVRTEDGRTLSGFIEDQDKQVVVLKAADGQKTVIERDDIEAMRAVPRSVMPEGLLKQFNDQQIRDLFAYLRASQPLP